MFDLGVVDWDGTMTKGKNSMQIVNQITPEHTHNATVIDDLFGMAESSALPRFIKSYFMQIWWERTLGGYIQNRLAEETIHRAAAMTALRPFAYELMQRFNDEGRQLVIMSAGLGDVISVVLEEKRIEAKVISNYFEFVDGYATSLRGKLLHTCNKRLDVAAMGLKENAKILLIGNNPDDADMVVDAYKIGISDEAYIPRHFSDRFDRVISGSLEPAYRMLFR